MKNKMTKRSKGSAVLCGLMVALLAPGLNAQLAPVAAATDAAAVESAPNLQPVSTDATAANAAANSATSEQGSADGFELPQADITGAAVGNAANDLTEVPALEGVEPVSEYSAPALQEPLTEVAAKPPTGDSVREAAPPKPNAEGRYLAADLVAASMLSGPGFTVAPEVEVRGYMLHFVLQTEFGDIAAESKALLPIRIEEVSAIERLDDTGMTEAAGKRAKQRGKQFWAGIKRVFTRPKETVSGLPMGIARMVKTRAVKLGRQASKLYDRSRDEVAEDDNAPEPTGPLTAARQPKPPSDESTVERESKRAGKQLLKDELDFGSTRRFIAQELGVDPYSSNPVLKTKLDALAWSATSSNVGYKLAMGALGAATAGVVPNLLKIDRTVWEVEPENLANTNRLRLNELGCTHGLTRRLVRNSAFSPTLQTDLVNALTALALPRGCDQVLELGIDARGEVEGRFVVNSLRMLLSAPLPGRVGYGAGECEIDALGGGLGATCLGELLVPVPVDALIWDDDMAAFLDAEHVRGTGARTILLSGFANREARTKLTDRGFAIVERAPLN